MATSSSVAALVNRDAHDFNDPMFEGGALRVIPFTYEKVAGNTDGDRIQLARVRSNWIVYKIEISTDAIANFTDINVGLWTDAAVGSDTDVDENVYADALDLNAGLALGAANHAFTTRNKDKVMNRVWQDAGATSDTNRWYRVCINIATGGTNTGTISGFVHCIVPAS